LIVLGICLLLANASFSQEKYPVLIPYENDTLIAISQYQFDVVLFSFSYTRSLENTLSVTSKELTRADSINTYLEKVLTLERTKTAYKDSINVNLEKVIQDYKKARKREKLKKTFTYIGMGLVIGLEAGVITYLLLK
jgi:hypothetical protein